MYRTQINLVWGTQRIIIVIVIIIIIIIIILFLLLHHYGRLSLPLASLTTDARSVLFQAVVLPSLHIHIPQVQFDPIHSP